MRRDQQLQEVDQGRQGLDPSVLQQRLLDLLIHHPDLDAIWLLSSRAMGRERPGSDIDLCIDAARLRNLWTNRC